MPPYTDADLSDEFRRVETIKALEGVSFKATVKSYESRTGMGYLWAIDFPDVFFRCNALNVGKNTLLMGATIEGEFCVVKNGKRWDFELKAGKITVEAEVPSSLKMLADQEKTFDIVNYLSHKEIGYLALPGFSECEIFFGASNVNTSRGQLEPGGQIVGRVKVVNHNGRWGLELKKGRVAPPAMGSILTIAIDESGEFQEQKLGQGPNQSGVAAVACILSSADLTSKLCELAAIQGITFPGDFHARELVKGKVIRAKQVIPGKEGHAIVKAVLAGMTNLVHFRAGVHGDIPGRTFFHEQQAYGEKLLCLLSKIGAEHQADLAAHEVHLVIATRNQDKLLGYSDHQDYNNKMRVFLEGQLPGLGWPRATRISLRSATQDPFLILADFHANLTVRGADWSSPVTAITRPSSYQNAMAELMDADLSSMLLYKLSVGKPIGETDFAGRSEQTVHDALRRLAGAAQCEASARNLDYAYSIAESIWPIAEKRSMLALKAELGRIASEVFSHRGLPGSDAQVKMWSTRTTGLPDSAFGSSTPVARAARLEHRCQTVQLDHFNVFAFQEVYWEFMVLREQYEAFNGGVKGIFAGDELYGKLLGTLAQACGFLRAQDAAVGAEAFPLLNQSAECFVNSIPLYRAMSLGYKLTDLWDRCELDAAEKLMNDEALPVAKEADPYSLLHRLRIAAYRKELNQKSEPLKPLIERLLVLIADPGSVAQTPYDLCLKWAIYLDVGNAKLQTHAVAWLAGLGGQQAALRATSLPLLVLLKKFDDASRTVMELKRYPGFARHWSTLRAAALAECIEDSKVPDFESLRAMPWNYG